MPAINGSDFLLYIDNTAIGLSTGATLEYTIDTIDVTSKDNDGYGKFIPGLKSGTVNFESFANYNDELSVFTAYNNDASVSYSLSDNTTSSTGNRFTGSGIITSVSITWDMESPATSSGTVELIEVPVFTAAS